MWWQISGGLKLFLLLSLAVDELAVVAAALNDALFAMYSITAQSELHQQHSSSLYFGLKLLYSITETTTAAPRNNHGCTFCCTP